MQPLNHSAAASATRTRVSRLGSTLTLPSPASGRGQKKRTTYNALRNKKSPRPFRWERARVRALSSPAGERNETKQVIVVIVPTLTPLPEAAAGPPPVPPRGGALDALAR